MSLPSIGKHARMTCAGTLTVVIQFAPAHSEICF
jgi:hypothetical protein